jgi:hypothetical protein
MRQDCAAARFLLQLQRARAFQVLDAPSEQVGVMDVSLRFQRDGHEAGSLSRQ